MKRKEVLHIALTVWAVISAIVVTEDRRRARKAPVPHRQGFYEEYIKRVQDFWCACAAAVALSPVMVVIGVAVWMKLGSPVLFRQERPGWNGRVFELWKFRTMTDERDAEENPLPDEARLTEFGKVLRSTSLDELPELWNIIKGDMAVVGPRPLLVKYLPRYSERQRHRHDVRPGLTGLAQVSGRNGLGWEERFEDDVQYAENISFLSDWKIILRTVQSVIARDGIHSEQSATMYEFLGNEKTGTVEV